MPGPIFGKVTESGFKYGMRERIPANDVREKDWYNIRVACDDARQLGAYALEFVVVVKTFRALDDCHELSVEMLDADGKVVGDGDALMRPCGMTYNPENAGDEGYLMGYNGYLDDSLKIAAENQDVYQSTH